MDGREYLSTANFFDMRFVPDEVDFDDDKPRDTCDRVPDGYRPTEFVTEALTHSKVRLTWDEEDQGRKDVQKRAFSRQEIDENDLKAYIGSSSDSSEGEDEVEVVDGTTGTSTKTAPKQSKAEAARAKMRAALGLSDSTMASKSRQRKAAADGDDDTSAPSGGMQITFTAGLSSTAPEAGASVFKNKPEDVAEETTIERYKRKERERKERRKAKAKAERSGDGGDDGGLADEADTAADAITDALADAEADDPFNDPFFTDPSAANAAAKKAVKKAKRDAAAAEAAASEERKQKERAELELLMAGDDGGDGMGERGFSMTAIRKAEKQAGKKGKKKDKNGKAKKGGETDIEAEGKANSTSKDGFVLDVADDRFKEAFESHEYAIDPSHARYVETEGMRNLLQEGRRRREERVGEEDELEKKAKRVNAPGKRKAGASGGEIDDLVEKIKRRKATA